MNNKLDVVVKQPKARNYYYDLIIKAHTSIYGTLRKEEIGERIAYLQDILYY